VVFAYMPLDWMRGDTFTAVSGLRLDSVCYRTGRALSTWTWLGCRFHRTTGCGQFLCGLESQSRKMSLPALVYTKKSVRLSVETSFMSRNTLDGSPTRWVLWISVRSNLCRSGATK
jgi:hypothetical protein